jgi:hypothetical protein
MPDMIPHQSVLFAAVCGGKPELLPRPAAQGKPQ